MTHVEGVDDGHGYGVRGTSRRLSGFGVLGRSDSGSGVKGEGDSGDGIFGMSNTGVGVRGNSTSYVGVYGFSDSLYGVYGQSNRGPGVYAQSNMGVGVYSQSENSTGVIGVSTRENGVRGHSISQVGVYSTSHDGNAIYGRSDNRNAAFLEGNVEVTGTINKAAVRFKIDHPLDPANKYLYHSSVESPDMKNVYDGVVALNDKGEAEIELSNWFGALNKDFRYQLTAIGAPGPNLYIAEEISDMATTATNYSNDSSNNNNNSSRFKIAGGTSGMKVSWQVTGIRKDPWANANRIQVEEEKPDKERGYYLHPDLYGQPEEKGISRLLFPKEEEELLINENKPTL